ncbi:phosphoribosylformylglycinamidine synthase subunit PurQ [candidate division KSB1 bacterium]|nr:phosphoribosylformylglycinamidine synthase subunit PurQ [candidate division KSB1 bacterium]
MTWAVVTFPGSNCDRDSWHALGDVLGFDVKPVFHKTTTLPPCDAVVIPGGFSYGDYLRCGALAKLSPIMPAIRAFADGGGLVVGICNGFQILCEAGLLPGALVRNSHLRFVSRLVSLRVERADTAFTGGYAAGDLIDLPIAHGEGNYVADAATIVELEREHRILFRYTGPVRSDVPDGNPNGSTNAIAGIMNRRGNVMGMMPHPERATDPLISRPDGANVFHSMAAWAGLHPRLQS